MENQEATALAEQLTSQPNAQQTYDDRALRDELKALRDSNAALQNHVQMMQWQQPAPQQPPQQAYNPFQGRDPKDSLLVEDAARSINEIEHRLASKFQAELAEVKLAAKSADYKDVINKYLPKAAQEDPDLLNNIKRSPDPMLAAYWAAKASKAYQEDLMSNYRNQQTPTLQAKPKPDPEAEKIVNNLKQSGSIAQVSNNAMSAGSNLDYGRMTDAEFKSYKSNLKFKKAGR